MRKGQKRSGNRRRSFPQGFWWPKKKKWKGSESDRFLTTLCTKKCLFFYRKGSPPQMVEIHGKWSEQHKFKPFWENRLQKTIHRIWRCWYWISSEDKDIFSLFTGYLVTKTNGLNKIQNMGIGASTKSNSDTVPSRGT